MTLILMSTDSDAKTVNKTVQTVKECECKVYGSCSLLAPVMFLKYDSVLTNCNYAYIPDYGRYYFMKSPVMLSGGRCLLGLTVDPLMSHKDGIKNLFCNITRYERTGMTMLADSNIANAGHSIEIINFPDSFIENGVHSYVLSVLGGV